MAGRVPRKGRCAGRSCGREFPSLKTARLHVAICPEFAKLYRESPASALDPEQEWQRVQDEKHDEELRAVRKSETRTRLSTESDRKLAEAARRWAPEGKFTASRLAGTPAPIPQAAVLPPTPAGYGPATTSFLLTLAEVVDSATP